MGGPLSDAGVCLEGAGYDVTMVDAPEILESFAVGAPPDLVILDEAFGERGGVATCQELRESPFWRNVSMMVVVAAGEQRIEECFVSGINDFVLWPFPCEELLHKARRLTEIPARRALNTLVRVREIRQGGATWLGKTLNVSRTGLLAEVEGTFAVGTPVEVEFYLPAGSVPVKARGRVSRRAPEVDSYHPSLGVEFDVVAEEDVARVDAWVAERPGRSA